MAPLGVVDPGGQAQPGEALQSRHPRELHSELYVPAGHTCAESRGKLPLQVSPGGHTKKEGEAVGVYVGLSRVEAVGVGWEELEPLADTEMLEGKPDMDREADWEMLEGKPDMEEVEEPEELGESLVLREGVEVLVCRKLSVAGNEYDTVEAAV